MLALRLFKHFLVLYPDLEGDLGIVGVLYDHLEVAAFVERHCLRHADLFDGDPIRDLAFQVEDQGGGLNA